MKIHKALKHVLNGKSVRRLSWKEKYVDDCYLCFKNTIDQFILVTEPEKNFQLYIPSTEDLLANDWEILITSEDQEIPDFLKNWTLKVKMKDNKPEVIHSDYVGEPAIVKDIIFTGNIAKDISSIFDYLTENIEDKDIKKNIKEKQTELIISMFRNIANNDLQKEVKEFIKDNFQPPEEEVKGNFSYALNAVRAGKSAYRECWVFLNMITYCIYLVPANKYEVQTEQAKSFAENGLMNYNAYIAFRNSDNSISMYQPSNDDLLADDWIVIDTVKVFNTSKPRKT